MVILAILIVVFMFEVIGFCFEGWYIKESDLDYYLTENLDKYRINGNMLYNTDLPYIAKRIAPSRGYHIEDYGTVPRWSKWDKRIKRKFKEYKKPTKSLRDF